MREVFFMLVISAYFHINGGIKISPKMLSVVILRHKYQKIALKKAQMSILLLKFKLIYIIIMTITI